MFRFPNLTSVNVQGPFWTAKVRVLEAAASSGGTGTALLLTDFDRFSRSLSAVMVPNANAFTASTISGQPGLQSSLPQLTVAKTNSTVPLSDALLFRGRFRLERNPAANDSGSIIQAAVFTDDSLLRFYSLGLDTENGKPVDTPPPGNPNIPKQENPVPPVDTPPPGNPEPLVNIPKQGNPVPPGNIPPPTPIPSSKQFAFTLGGDAQTLQQIGGEKSFTLVAEPNVSYLFRLEVKEAPDGSGTEIAAKVWKEVDPEPDFFIKATNVSPSRLKAKTVGLRASGPGTKQFSNLEVGASGGEFALRTLFTEDRTRAVTGQSAAFVPHTVIALCEPLEVGMSNSAFAWTRAATAKSALDLSEAEIRAALKSGALSLLMLSVDPAQLALGRLDLAYRCVSGSIDLNTMQPQNQSVLELRRSLIGELAGNSQAQLAVNASGLAIRDQVKLPWDNVTTFAAPFLLTKSNLNFRLTLDAERLSDDERKALLRAWAELASFLNPKSPLNGTPSDDEVPQWMTLEIASPRSLPRFSREWTTEPWKNANALAPAFTFAEGQFNVLLTDQQPDNRRTPPRSLARIVPQQVSIRRESAPVRLVVEVNQQPLTGVEGLRYDATLAAGVWTESFTLSDTTLSYDPVETARALRGFAQLPAPQWERPQDADPQPLDVPLLWAFMPLEDGWAQLPIANLTEQIYLDAKLVPEPKSALAGKPSFEGAASFSNQDPKLPEEQAWSLTITSGGPSAGKWTFEATPSNGRERFRPIEVKWEMQSPEFALDGLMWLSTGKPTLQDALPDHSDWVAGLQSIPLRTAKPTDLFPPAWQLALSSPGLRFAKATGTPGARVKAQLGAWQYTYRPDPAVTQKLKAENVWQEDTLASAEALIWRRHAQLPMIQALPMTQSQQPPNYPSASRQLAPFAVADGVRNGWSFGVDAQGAAHFPSLKSVAVPEPQWARMSDLPMACLSVPGVFLNPSADDLVPKYRFDLPYSDEVNAFAEVPQVSSAAASRPTDAALRIPPPLARDTFAPHWQRLADRASLAAGDAVDAFTVNGAPAAITQLIEPLSWVATPKLGAVYPGSLSLDDVPLHDSLEGLTANFTRSGTTLTRDPAGEIKIVSGSMASEARNNQIRDQRGLARSVTSATPDLVSTPVNLGGAAHELLSSAHSLSLKAGNEDWTFWFRDLPLKSTATGAGQFKRRELPNDVTVNEPEALSSSLNYLRGYEWRLGAGQPLSLYQLDFFPLTLEKVEVVNEQVSSCELLGRLQLPLVTRQEQEGFENVVQLTFTRIQAGPGEPRLVLTSIDAVGSFVEWPLALQAGTPTTEPRLRWKQLGLSSDRAKLELRDGTLDFFLFGESWSAPMPTASFPGSGPDVALEATLSAPPERAGLFPQKVTCKLSNLPTRLHTAQMSVAVRLGDTLGRAFRSSLDFPLLGSSAPTASAAIFDHLAIGPEGKPEVRSQGRSLQFAWDTHGTSRPVQLLSGMHVSTTTKARGFAALTFDVEPVAGNSIPGLLLKTAFVEALIPCAWGASLQEPGADDDVRIFGSSAGTFTFSFSSELQGQNWSESLLLNGFLEVKDLISWPTALAWDESKRLLTLPASAAQLTLPHLRHTIRILLNQHPMPTALFTRGDGNLMFKLAPGKTWQFLAVVEHQLAEMAPLPLAPLAALGLPAGQAPPPTPPPPPVLPLAKRNDHRWTALQEVRIVRPADLRAYLESHPDPAGVEGTGNADGGFLRRGLRTQLITQLVAAPPEMLLVEASAPHWIRQTPVKADSQTTLQFLPDGSQQAILSTPGDFASDAAGAANWLLLTTPFLGRLQSQELDHVAAPGSALQVDPVLRLQRPGGGGTQRPFLLALTSWADTQSLSLDVATSDAEVTHLWPRLDPLSLEENWLRLQRPETEPPVAGLRSVMAALPDTPARLSRPHALRRAFDANRPASDPLPELEESGPLVWRRQSQMVTQFASATPTTVPYGFHLVGLQMQSWLKSEAAMIRRYAAVTVIPSGQTAAPVSYVVSPYLGLGFLRAPANVTPDLRSVELVCLDRAGGGLVPVASRLFDGKIQPDAWAQATLRLLAPESPIAILRQRVINVPAARGRAGETQLTTSYAFRLLTMASGAPAEALTQRAFPIRAAVANLRFREGMLGTQAPPPPAANFELAPPQVSVQPLYLKQRPDWPWGWSGLRFSVRHGDGQAAIGEKSSALWWQAPHWITQFRSAQSGGAPVAGLPAVFRAPAILSLLPVLPSPPLPPLAVDADWQPVLPGQLHYVVTGGRAGTIMALRHQLIRQSSQGSLVSGSVPVQHRVPRPVPLPDNLQSDSALQTWASFLNPPQNALVTPNPADEALFLGPQSQPGAARVRLTLESRALDPRSDGVLVFGIQTDGTLPAPVVKSLSLTDGRSVIAYQAPENSGSKVVFKPSLSALPETTSDWQKLIGRQRPGATLWARVNVERSSLVQTLSFPLRVIDTDAVALPLVPFFVQFEDPEYNRRLASSSARASQTLRKGEVVHTVTLAADRQIYNPDSAIALRHDWDIIPDVSVELSISVAGPSGIARVLQAKRNMAPNTLESIALPSLPGALMAGNVLELKLTIPGAEDLVLRVNIVAEPVVPVPEAAYALLRHSGVGEQSQVECVRFAWSPQATRVELVCAEDLKSEVVRRRAVFQWVDTARPKSVDTFSYAIQKIAQNGSTHFPELPVPIPA